MTAVGLLEAAGYALAAASSGAGAWAAWLWYRASRVPISALWGLGSEPVDPQQSTHGWLVATIVAFEEAGALNARAARWTALAVVATALQPIVSGAASYFKP